MSKKEKEVLWSLAWHLINHLYAANGGGSYIDIDKGVTVLPDELSDREESLVWGDELGVASTLRHQGKYAVAEQLYEAGIRRYKKCRESLDNDELKLGDILGNTDVDLQKVLSVARSEIDRMIDYAENEYRFVREQRAKGIDEISSEERYKKITHELKRAKRSYIIQSVILVSSTVVLIILVDAFSFPTWITTALFFFCVIYILFLVITYGLGVEYTFKGMEDPDILEWANRDGYYDMDFVSGSAFSEGKLAFSKNVDLNANPYQDKNHKKAAKWNAGWEEASRKRKDFERDFWKRKR